MLLKRSAQVRPPGSHHLVHAMNAAQPERTNAVMDRAEYERNLDWQFGIVSKQRQDEGKPPLTRSEWLSGAIMDAEGMAVEEAARRKEPPPIWVSALLIGGFIGAAIAAYWVF